VPDTPQTRSSAYRLAFADNEFLCQDALRPVRLQLELLKPEMGMDEQDIRSTIVLFGGARIPEPAKKDTARTKTLADLSKYYAEAREFARLMTERSDGHEDVIVTGGGPGVMEAGNRGAVDAGGRSIGLNIVLPHEQAPNEYVTPELCYNFHYFAIRKMHFLMRARAVAVFPGGFGTLDETFEARAVPAVRRGLLALHHQLGNAGGCGHDLGRGPVAVQIRRNRRTGDADHRRLGTRQQTRRHSGALTSVRGSTDIRQTRCVAETGNCHPKSA